MATAEPVFIAGSLLNLRRAQGLLSRIGRTLEEPSIFGGVGNVGGKGLMNMVQPARNAIQNPWWTIMQRPQTGGN